MTKYDIFVLDVEEYYKYKKVILDNAGYIESEKFDRDEFWRLCNWSAWTNTKPENLFSKISSCSTNIVFYDPDTEIYHVPLGIGWKEFSSFEDVQYYYDFEYYKFNKVSTSH